MLFRTIERLLLGVGLTLLTAFLAVMAYRAIGSRVAIRSFQVAAGGSRSAATPASAGTVQPDYSLWDTRRIAAYRDSLVRQFDPPLAILRIPKLRVEVAVFDGTDELILNRGVGRIAGTASIGDSGNIGIAGHRDGFFRCLKDIAVGDIVTLSSPSDSTTYAVDQIEIVTPEDVRVLAPRASPSVTLVTCYPFYYSGAAPQRFIVHCSRREKRPNLSSGNSRSDQSRSTNLLREKET
jgi:sortase A